MRPDNYFSDTDTFSNRRCACCIMPETEGHIFLDDDGICNICNKYKISQGRGQIDQTEKNYVDLKNMIASVKEGRQGEYDSIVAVSGGKDSTMTLYIAKKELNLNPLAVFIDNGFCCEEMYNNVKNATDILGIDLLVYKPQLVKNIFHYLLLQEKPVYYCRICNGLIDYYVREIALKYNITTLLGGYTKGQDFLKGRELFWIYRVSDQNLREGIEGIPEFQEVWEMFDSLSLYFHKKYSSLSLISPFQYLDYNEDKIVEFLYTELGFQLPRISWPVGSTNCLFNFVSQYLSQKQFGYSQHEVEISTLVRNGEISRERGMEIINTPITQDHISMALERIGLTYKDIS